MSMLRILLVDWGRKRGVSSSDSRRERSADLVPVVFVPVRKARRLSKVVFRLCRRGREGGGGMRCFGSFL